MNKNRKKMEKIFLGVVMGPAEGGIIGIRPLERFEVQILCKVY